MWITKGARFNASRRLDNNYYFSLTSISILSVYGISVSFIQDKFIPESCPRVDDIYFLISIILSIFTLTFSLLEGSKNHQVRAERLKLNAIEIEELCRKLEYFIFHPSKSKDEKYEAFFVISKEYESLIQKCPENHESEDFELFKAQHGKDFNVHPFQASVVKATLFFKYYWLYCLAVFGVPALMLSLYFSC